MNGANYDALLLMEAKIGIDIPGKPVIGVVMDPPHKYRNHVNLFVGWMLKVAGYRINCIAIWCVRCGDDQELVRFVIKIVTEVDLLGKDKNMMSQKRKLVCKDLADVMRGIPRVVCTLWKTRYLTWKTKDDYCVNKVT